MTLTLNPPQRLPLPQEDAHAAVLDLPDGGSKGALFAVLDGHGGAEVARFVANHLVGAGPAVGAGQNCGAGCWESQEVVWMAGCRASNLPPATCRFSASQAQQVVSTPGYQAGDMERALKEAYLRIDELLVKVGSFEILWCFRSG